MRFIGLTGGIGAGKTQILNYISEHYPAEVYPADEVAHLVEQPGEKAYLELVELLGESILDLNDPDAPLEEAPIDRKAMAAAIFGSDELLQQVNEIIHPAVREFLIRRYEQAKADGKTELFVVEAALLIECGYAELVDEMWYVYASEEVRIQRLMENRGYSREKAISILSVQLSEDEFRKNSDFVIDNSGPVEEAFEQVRAKLEAFSWRE